MYSARDIASYVISSYCNNGKAITNMKLQKILYYIQGYALIMCGTPAFSDDIHIWAYGPVVPEVYFEYCLHRSNPIPKQDRDLSSILEMIRNAPEIINVVDAVIQKSFLLTDKEIVEMACGKMDPQKRIHTKVPIQSIVSDFIGCDPLGVNR